LPNGWRKRMLERENRTLLKDMLRMGLLILMIGGVLFLYLLQKLRSRDQDTVIQRLVEQQMRVIREINRVEYEIERIRRPGV
jgi:hypothetical protein